MHFHSKGRSALRFAAVAAVAAGSLAGASSANAAIAGARVPTFTEQPNLISVTSNGTNAITYKFNRNIECVVAATCSPANYNIYQYDPSVAVPTNGPGPLAFGNAIAATSATSSGDSIRVNFNKDLDQDALTNAFIAANTVKASGSLGAQNLADSRTITNTSASATENGTRGYTTGPDILSVVETGGGSNALTITYDQEVTGIPGPDNTKFYFLKSDGTQIQALTATVALDKNQVEVAFPANQPVSAARQLLVTPQAVSAADSNIRSVRDSSDLLGHGFTSQAPTLRSAEIAGADRINFVFDQNIKIAAASGPLFKAILSTGLEISGIANSATVTAPDTVQVQFSTDQFTEYLVEAGVADAAVQGVSNNKDGANGGAPIGGNAGAKAQGYTAAPDITAVDLSGANAIVTFDSRFDPAPASVVAANFHLFAADGSDLGAPTIATPQAQGVPGPSRLNLQYNSTIIRDALVLQAKRAGVQSNTPTAYPNVEQLVNR